MGSIWCNINAFTFHWHWLKLAIICQSKVKCSAAHICAEWQRVTTAGAAARTRILQDGRTTSGGVLRKMESGAKAKRSPRQPTCMCGRYTAENRTVTVTGSSSISKTGSLWNSGALAESGQLFLNKINFKQN